ncbi:uncharacterized protein [Eurosta solidaginis]|uniref:uncharacterized protein n=1 Tax=Eurosta solidaginis TaxID=178769 RepID=UPI003530BA4E
MEEYNYAPPAPPTKLRHIIIQKYLIALHHFRNTAEKTFQVRPFYFDNYVLWQYLQQRSIIQMNSDLDIGSSYTTTTTPMLAFLKLELLNQILNRRRQILYWTFYLILISLCFFAYRYRLDSPSSELSTNPSLSLSSPVQSVHSFVYPSMRMWRRITLPLIKRFPRLTEFHDESCLMQNPFFQGIDVLNCDSCSYAQSVVDLSTEMTEPSQLTQTNGIENSKTEISNMFVPFVFKINQEPIELEDFYKIYVSNQKTFKRDAFRVQSTNPGVTNLEELFSKFNQSHISANNIGTFEVHNMWRCNRMLPARLLRKLFASSTLSLPRSGIALERYMAIDTAQAAAYTLPNTECPDVYVQQALGVRYIFLRPTSECRHRCRTLSLRLPQAFVLSYNWLYWKPISAPDPLADTLSISLIGSYC